MKDAGFVSSLTVTISATIAIARPRSRRGRSWLLSLVKTNGTKLPLIIWFLEIHLLTRSKNAISAMEISRQLEVTYNSDWLREVDLQVIATE